MSSSPPQNNRYSWLGVILLVYIFVSLCLLIYWPGLNGSFTVDDYPNLIPLGFFGGINDWKDALYFIFSNSSGPLGRPISMASFLINDHTWPSTAWEFKYTNLMLHLINGLLIFWLTISLLQKYSNRHWWALAVMALWLLHPLQVSTVLYVVQRMTILSTLFSLLVLISFVKWRNNLGSEDGWRKILSIILLLSLLGLLGILSKETAISTIFYLLVIDYLWFDKSECATWQKYRKFILLIPSLLVFMAIITFSISASSSWETRDFTLVERLMSQSRVVTDYLHNIIVPHSAGTGLVQDDWTASRGLLNPPSTILSIIFLTSLIACAIIFINKNKLFSFGIFWFFVGHFLESTTLPLELYFEHRNYLPLFGIIIAIISLTSKLNIKIIFSASTVYFALFLFVLTGQVQIWSNTNLMSSLWALEHPNSKRAQQTAVASHMRSGNLDQSLEILNKLLVKYPTSTLTNLQILLIDCLQDKDDIVLNEYIHKFQNAELEYGTADQLRSFQKAITQQSCQKIALADLIGLTLTLIENPNYQSARVKSSLYSALSDQYVEARNLNGAISSLEKAFVADPSNISYPLAQAKLLYSAGLKNDAINFLEIAKGVKPSNIMLKPKHDKLILGVENHINGKIQSPGIYNYPSKK